MKRVVCFGEIMMRLNPKGYLRFLQAGEFEASYAGGEANVAVSLAQFGVSAAYITKVPAHEIGQAAINELRRFGVDTSLIVRGGERLGIYFVEKGASQRPSKVIYDRAHSAITEAESGDFDWEALLKGADWFHFTGITPALSDNCTQRCKEALDAAKKLGVPVSCDLNYRKKLWSREKAGQVMGELMPNVDLCIANEEDAADVFGIHAQGTDINSGALSHEGYVSVAKQLTSRFGFKKVAITLRGSISASDNNWSGMLYDGKSGNASFGANYAVRIVDRVGGGDSFGGALIYSQLEAWDDQKAINFAVAASCLKHTIEHDFNIVSVAEIEALAAGNASGRVQR
jgi:2-dehydro-3-deoxygluconokinase